MATVNRKYKNDLFVSLFENEERLRRLYNAITNSNYGPETKVEINTLDDVLFKGKVNDISFTLGDKLVVLLEHQSSINENLPLRFFVKIIDKMKGYIAIMGNKECAAQATLKDCLREGILPEYMSKAGAEVENMLLTQEWDWNEAVKVWKEEAIEEWRETYLAEGRAEGLAEGIQHGRAEGMREVAAAMKAKGYTAAQICELTGLSADDVACL